MSERYTACGIIKNLVNNYIPTGYTVVSNDDNKPLYSIRFINKVPDHNDLSYQLDQVDECRNTFSKEYSPNAVSVFVYASPLMNLDYVSNSGEIRNRLLEFLRDIEYIPEYDWAPGKPMRERYLDAIEYHPGSVIKYIDKILWDHRIGIARLGNIKTDHTREVLLPTRSYEQFHVLDETVTPYRMLL